MKMSDFLPEYWHVWKLLFYESASKSALGGNIVSEN